MLELLKSLVFAVIMVPVVMAIILGLFYGLGEVFNIRSEERRVVIECTSRHSFV